MKTNEQLKTGGEKPLNNRVYLSVTLPFMLSTMTQPLMGAVDTAMMGHFSDPAYISGVALGAVLFNTIYWLFGFLRVGTTGYAAQALGSQKPEDRVSSYGRPLVLALFIGAALLALQAPILQLYLYCIAPAREVAGFVEVYYRILIWGAPFVLFNYVSLGWLMGQAKIRATLFMQISGNLMNIMLCIAFVRGLGWGVQGVAAATLIAQIYTSIAGLKLMHAAGAFSFFGVALRVVFAPCRFAGLLGSNVNLMLRTACLLTVNNLFAAASTSFGTTTLAANAVLLQILGLMSYLIDGMANGNSLFVGRAVGRQDAALFEATRRMSLKWLAALAALLALGCAFGGGRFVSVFTASEDVRGIAAVFIPYLAAYPFCAGIGMTLYGMFTGATYTAPVRDMMFLALLCFLLARYTLVPAMGNHGLWISYLLFYLAQSFFLGVFVYRLRKKIGFYKCKAGDGPLRTQNVAGRTI